MLKSLQLTVSDHYVLSDYCKQFNIDFLSTAFGPSELELLVSLGIPAIKVPSGEITNLPLLEAMASSSIAHDLPVYLSTGMCPRRS